MAIDRAAQARALADGSILPYDKLLLATGALPRRLPLPGADGAALRLSPHLRRRACASAAHLSAGSHIAIVGGGFIGLELAASARKRGASVTVIEAQPRILMRGVPEEIAQVIDARASQPKA